MEYSGTPIDFPVMVTVTFAIPRARTSKLLVPMGDIDNFEKALYDMLQRKRYLSDDKFIVDTHCSKRFLPFGEVGYCEVVIQEYTGPMQLVGEGED